jgi:phosphatidylinositol-binding clathrin assembly protein
MSRPDAERALNIYKTFGRQTDQVVQYLTVARQYENLTRLEVPRLKHAPTTLTSSLEEYLNDPEFEVNRRQYLAQAQGTKDASKSASKSATTSTLFDKAKKSDSTFPAPEKPAAQEPVEAKGPAPDLIDFFDSIEQNQQPMAQPNVAPQPVQNGFPQAQQYQQTGFAPQQTGYNPFLPNQQQTAIYAQQLPQQQQPQFPQQPQTQLQPLQQDFTGAGFGGYAPQLQQQLAQPPQQPLQYNFQSTLSSIPHDGVPSFDQQQQQQPYQQQPPQIQTQPTSSNPFRQSMMPTGASTGSTVTASPLNRQSTNPFAKPLNPQPTATAPSSSLPFPSSNSPFTSPPTQTQQQELQQNSSFFSPPPQAAQTQSLLPQRTGTNPFARNRSPAMNSSPAEQQQPSGPFLATATGSTNPFRQSQFVNQQTGLGWQNVPGSQGTFGGYDVNNVDTVPIFPRPGGNS